MFRSVDLSSQLPNAFETYKVPWLGPMFLALKTRLFKTYKITC